MSPQTNGSDRTESAVSRRRLLRGAGVAAVGLGGLAAGSTGALAGKGDDCENPRYDFPRVSTRGHFETGSGVTLTDGNDEYNFDTAGDPIPGWHTDPAAELLVFVHGWDNSPEGALCTFVDAESTFRAEGYYQPFVGYTWDSDEGWYDATEIAERNGAKLAYFAYSYAANNPDVRVRFVAHSLGARVVLMALRNLAHWDRLEDVDSVSILGGAADDDSVSMEGTYGGDIAAAAGRVDNFWMDDDEVLNWAYGAAEWGKAIGNAGCDGTPPWNYADHDVGYVPGHGDYYREDGCVHEVVATF